MKRIALIIVIALIPCNAFCQVELTGAMGLTFGMNPTTVKGILVKKGGKLSTEAAGALSNLTYLKVPMGTMTAVVGYL